MKSQTLRTKLSLVFVLVVLVTVMLISVLANIYINSAFESYITRQQTEKAEELASSIAALYYGGTWDLNFVHAIGMYALYDGYILTIADSHNQILWSAEDCDMTACMQVMDDVTERMKTKYPKINGEFTKKTLLLTQNGENIGTISIGYFGPFFFSDNDFHFLDTLNTVLLIVGIFSLCSSVLLGVYMASRISKPLDKAADVAQKMSNGDYCVFAGEKTGTKELDKLLAAINKLAKTLSYQETLRKRLTADVAHELRTPITTVQIHLEAMINGLWETTPENLTSCHEEVTRMGAIVGDLEKLAKVESESFSLNKKQISLSPIVRKIADSFTMEMKNKDLTLTLTDESTEVCADEDRIRQVVVNLLSNAIKYTPHGGEIEVSLSQTDKFVTLDVSDNGVGISENELPFIFERFYRADKSRNRKTGGKGLGLAIAKAIVEAHGGIIEAYSTVGEGSMFRLILPKDDSF